MVLLKIPQHQCVLRLSFFRQETFYYQKCGKYYYATVALLYIFIDNTLYISVQDDDNAFPSFPSSPNTLKQRLNCKNLVLLRYIIQNVFCLQMPGTNTEPILRLYRRLCTSPRRNSCTRPNCANSRYVSTRGISCGFSTSETQGQHFWQPALLPKQANSGVREPSLKKLKPDRVVVRFLKAVS